MHKPHRFCSQQFFLMISVRYSLFFHQNIRPDKKFAAQRNAESIAERYWTNCDQLHNNGIVKFHCIYYSGGKVKLNKNYFYKQNKQRFYCVKNISDVP